MICSLCPEDLDVIGWRVRRRLEILASVLLSETREAVCDECLGGINILSGNLGSF